MTCTSLWDNKIYSILLRLLSIGHFVVCASFFRFTDSYYPFDIFTHPERRDYDVAKMGFKTGAGKT